MMIINDQTFNEIMKEAIEAYRNSPKKEQYFIADDVCRKHLAKFGRDIDAYETLVFQVTMNLVNLDR